jgi:large subunit ribosomal protein L18
MGKTQKKRKEEKKTNYKKRLGMLKSGIPRIVIRKTNNYLFVQYVSSEESKDKIIFGISSKELLKNGWPKELQGSLKSIPASYLTGKLFGKLLREKIEGKKAILDLGLQRNIHGGRIYAVLKGLVDSGIEISSNEKVFPKEERIAGKHLNEKIQKAFEKLNKEI